MGLPGFRETWLDLLPFLKEGEGTAGDLALVVAYPGLKSEACATRGVSYGAWSRMASALGSQ